MSEENERYRHKMGLFAPGRSSEADERIDETEGLLRNTMAFLDGLRESDDRAKAYVAEISESLERDLQRLRKRGDD